MTGLTGHASPTGLTGHASPTGLTGHASPTGSPGHADPAGLSDAALPAGPIVVTTGEPAGIGPEIALRVAYDDQRAGGGAAPAQPQLQRLTLLGDGTLLRATAQRLGLAWPPPAHVAVESVALAVPSTPGQLDARNARYVLAQLDAAIDGCRSGRFGALVTAPVHKGVINQALAGSSGRFTEFTGHTEYLAAATGAAQVVMLLVGGGLRVALATTHLPLAAVPAAISAAGLARTLDVLHHDLRRYFAIAAPRIAVTGLNPHAGEGGYLGREEIDVIAPAIDAARTRGIDASGPWPADTVFVAATATRFDVILAMYHDQGLGPLKVASFGQGVNVTLGLPFVRTSVDHGTALDLAGRGVADCGSLRDALALARELSHRPRTMPLAEPIAHR